LRVHNQTLFYEIAIARKINQFIFARLIAIFCKDTKNNWILVFFPAGADLVSRHT